MESTNSLKENGIKLRRWRPEESAASDLAASAGDAFGVSTFALFASDCPVVSDFEVFGAANMSASVRCRFKGFEAAVEATALSWDALGVMDASRVCDAVVSRSAR